jgi:hypothetical protein
MKKVKVDLLVVGNLLVISNLRGGVKSSNWNCYADESLYEADRVVHGDYEIDGDSDMSIAVTGGITIIRKEV